MRKYTYHSWRISGYQRLECRRCGLTKSTDGDGSPWHLRFASGAVVTLPGNMPCHKVAAWVEREAAMHSRQQVARYNELAAAAGMPPFLGKP